MFYFGIQTMLISVASGIIGKRMLYIASRRSSNSKWSIESAKSVWDNVPCPYTETLTLCSPNEDFGRPNKQFAVSFQSQRHLAQINRVLTHARSFVPIAKYSLGEHELHTGCTFQQFVAQIECSRHITVDRHARQHTGEYF